MGKEPRFLDGPKFTKWLTEVEQVNVLHLTESQKRRWRDWTLGQRADLYSSAVDRILTDHYIAIRLIPDDCWSENQLSRNEGQKHLPPKEQKARREEGRLLLRAGLHVDRIAEQLDVSPTTVRNWRRKMRKEDALDMADTIAA
jgi:DNA-binding NarL/FixJ family response regulator